MRRVAVILASVALLATVTAPAVGAMGDKAQGLAGTMGWAATYDVAPGTWQDGETVTFWMRTECPGTDCSGTYDPIEFTVSSSAPLYSGYVELRFWGVWASAGPLYPPTNVLNPAQRAKFIVVYFVPLGDGTTMADIAAARDATTTYFSTVGSDGPWTVMPNSPVMAINGANGPVIHDVWHFSGNLHRT